MKLNRRNIFFLISLILVSIYSVAMTKWRYTWLTVNGYSGLQIREWMTKEFVDNALLVAIVIVLWLWFSFIPKARGWRDLATWKRVGFHLCVVNIILFLASLIAASFSHDEFRDVLSILLILPGWVLTLGSFRLLDVYVSNRLLFSIALLFNCLILYYVVGGIIGQIYSIASRNKK